MSGHRNGFVIENDVLVKYYGSQTDVEVPDGVRIIACSSFFFCNRIETVALPNSVERIEDWAFGYCVNLKRIFIPSKVMYVSAFSFDHCDALMDIVVDPNNKSYCSNDGVLFDYQMNTLVRYPPQKKGETYTIPNTVSIIGMKAFTNNAFLRKMIVSEGVKLIEYKAFSYSLNLSEIVLPSSLETIKRGAFCNCQCLKSFTFSRKNPIFTVMGGALFDKNKSSLIQVPPANSEKEFVIPNFVEQIGYRALSYCTNIQTIKVQAGNPFFSDYQGVLFDKEMRTLIQYPIGQEKKRYSIPNSVQVIRESAFQKARHLSEVFIGNKLEKTENHVFEGCVNLTSIEFSSPFFRKISWGSFGDCHSLAKVELSKTSVDNVASTAFLNCQSLESIDFPSNLVRFGMWAFHNCSLLKRVNLDGLVLTKQIIEDLNYDADFSKIIR